MSPEKIEQIQRAAFLFARMIRDAHEIANALRVSSRTVQRLIHLPLFREELDRLGYQGEMHLRKARRAHPNPLRMKKPEYQKANQLWHRLTDIPEGHRARVIAEQEGINTNYNTVRRWIRD